MPVFRLSRLPLFPAPELAEPNGLLAVGGDLKPKRLLAAYRAGIFPWYSEDQPILWWSPSPRCVLFPEELHIPRRLARTLRQQVFAVTADTVFGQVIRRCGSIRTSQGHETWITRQMIQAYIRLHELGYAHSIECWQGKELVGGLYGICLDTVFFGESMFSISRDSSKVAFVRLVQYARAAGIRLIDCQLPSDHLHRFGAREISRYEFQRSLKQYIGHCSPQKKWRLP